MFGTKRVIGNILRVKPTKDNCSRNFSNIVFVGTFRNKEPIALKVIKKAGAQILKKEYAQDKYGEQIVEYKVNGNIKKLEDAAEIATFKHDGDIWSVDIWR